MKERRLVSVVLNWNRGRHDSGGRLLSRCSVPVAWNHTVIVVDNGSTDGSVVAIQQAGSAELLVHPTNLGFAKGNNAGLRWALENGADAVLLLNNDATVDDECCAHLIGALESDPKAGAAGPLICEEPRRDRIWYAVARRTSDGESHCTGDGDRSIEDSTSRSKRLGTFRPVGC
jgi:glycosyltransferase involved in cell wall biosynthesis